MNLDCEDGYGPSASWLGAEQVGDSARFGAKRLCATDARRSWPARGTLRRGDARGGSLDERDDHVRDREPQRLHKVEVSRWLVLKRESHKLVQPRHEHASVILTDSEHLRRLGEDGRSKVL